MKRIVSLILALSMVLSMFTFSFAGESLKDIDGTKYEAAVEALMELGVVSGYPDGTYLPDEVVTRAELAKLLVVAYGLAPAAEAAATVTPFADSNNMWASGYINVSADYKFVNGYPDGSFQPTGTVTYAEAITMCLRVLGYANEVDAKGTWPTNYIAKAQDLGLMDDIDYGSYNAGAKRGNIALLIWNMLRTQMWEVTGESEGDGLKSNPNRLMLNVKFADYAYAEDVIFKGFVIEEDAKEEVAKVKVSLDCNCAKNECKHDFLGVPYAYAGNDFYKFVSGTEVEVLVNEEEDTLLTMVPTGEDKLEDGTKEAYEDKYGYSTYVSDLTDVAYDYIYARLEKKDAKEITVLNATSTYVDKLEVKEDVIRINNSTKDAGNVEYVDYDYDEIVLVDGERVVFSKAIEVGDVLTEITVDFGGTNPERFFVIGSKEVEGEFDKYDEVYFEDSKATYYQLTIDGDKYPVDAKATYVENPEAKNINAKPFIGVKNDKMVNEEVSVVLDAIFGKIVRVNFDGKIDEGEESETVRFFGLVSDIKENDGVYSVVLTDGTDEDTYEFSNSRTAKKVAKALRDEIEKQVEATFAWVKLDDEGKITNLQIIMDYSGDARVDADIPYGDTTINPNEYYDVEICKAKYDKEKQLLDSYNVTESVTLVELILDKGSKKSDSDDEYRIEFTTGISAIDDLNGSKDVMIITDAKDVNNKVIYVVMASDNSDKSENQVDIVKKLNIKDVLAGKATIVLAGSKDVENEISEETLKTKNMEDYQLVVYTLTSREGKSDLFDYVAGLSDAELNTQTEGHGLVTNVDGNIFNIYDLTKDTLVSETLTNEANTDKYENYMFVMVNVSEETGNAGQFEVTSFEEYEAYEDIVGAIAENDRISIDDAAEVIFVIRGMHNYEINEDTKLPIF